MMLPMVSVAGVAMTSTVYWQYWLIGLNAVVHTIMQCRAPLLMSLDSRFLNRRKVQLVSCEQSEVRGSTARVF